MNAFIEHQNWRYATKKFDSSKKVTATDLEILKEAYSFECIFLRITLQSYIDAV
jgi:hypothetical protein